MSADHKPEDPFLPIAAAVADGAAVDWTAATRTTPEEHRRVMEQLEVVARIAAAHRALEPEASGTPDAKPEPDGAPAARRSDTNVLGHWGHLEVLAKIDSGACGEIYLARDPQLDHEVALKLRHPSTLGGTADTDLIREARLLARVDHPNVARVYGADRHDGRVGLWVELIRGHNLEELLEKQGRFGATEIINIGCDLCAAVAAVHAAGVVHRDLKTRNIMRAEGGRYTLLDFGVGCELTPDEETPWDTAGTPLYMAPELFRREPATVRSDIYSLGVVLFRLVSGRYPVAGESYLELKDAHAARRRSWMRDVRPDLPEALVRVIEKAIEPDPSRRYASAGEFERALASLRGEEPAAPAPSRDRWIKFLAAAVIIAAVVWIVIRETAYDVEASLHRMNGTVSEPLVPGATIFPGDELTLDFRGSRSLYVYVVSQDDAGASYLLFPMEHSELANPLAKGVTHRLPGTSDGAQLAWTVTSAGGREHVVVVASPHRLAEFEAEILALARPEDPNTTLRADASGRAVRLPEDAIYRLRGIGGIAKQPPDSSRRAEGGIFHAVERLEARAEMTRGTWVRQIDLVYPTP